MFRSILFKELSIEFYKQLIIIALTLSTGFILGKKDVEYEKRHEAVISRFSQDLYQMIIDASLAKNKDVFPAARALVSSRDDARTPAITLSKLLNSDIDVLADNIKKQDEYQTRETLKILKQKWPTKMHQIDNEVRKLITELGLTEK